MRRYARSSVYAAGRALGTSFAIPIIRDEIKRGTIPVDEYITKEGDRLDHIAAKKLGSGKYWWILAATSNVGWSMQVPVGTRLLIPESMDRIKLIVGG